MKKLLKILLYFPLKVVDLLLASRFKKLLKNKLTEQQKNKLKKWFRISTHQTQIKKIEELKYKLANLGFTEKAYSDFVELFQSMDDPYFKKLIAMELAVWHANHLDEVNARKALEFVSFLEVDNKDKDFKRRVAIIKAECLEILGEIEEARKTIISLMSMEEHPDLYLSLSNLTNTEEEKLEWINKALSMRTVAPISLNSKRESSNYDRLNSLRDTEKVVVKEKVSVIIPVYNAADVIGTSLEAMLSQSWTNLEIIVVDDCSTDNTTEIVQDYATKDNRIMLIKAEQNGGAYIARNIALQHATGEFVTINDADDWSHPDKIKTQVLHLLNNINVIGNTSQQARATNELRFFRRGKPGEYIFSNMSSFMFRREKVFGALGYWDSVRFGADSEYIKRIKRTFGERSIVELETGPLSFQRQTESSLTGNSAFGFPGFFMGARREYTEAHEYYHKHTDNLYYEFPIVKRPFAIPEPMLPNRKKSVRHFDVIIVSDFRLEGGSTLSSVEEIKAQKQAGLRTGIIQMARYDYPAKKKINPKIRHLLDGEAVQLLVYGEKVTCDLLILRYPPILQEWQKFVPNVAPKKINVIVNQTPMSDYGLEGIRRFEFNKAEENIKRYFGLAGKWYPIGPQVRKAIVEHHASELNNITLANEDWHNIIDIDEWKREPYTPNKDKIVIGRHSRSQYVKWPNNKEQLLQIYPDSNNYEIRILGGAGVPKKTLGKLPSNWHVLEFGEIHPKDFLKELDVFVYYTHPDWIESFGRVVIESMAVGVPVILPPIYRNLFKDAAIYAEPSEVKEKVMNLVFSNTNYDNQIKLAHDFVKSNFGYGLHLSRLEEKV